MIAYSGIAIVLEGACLADCKVSTPAVGYLSARTRFVKCRNLFNVTVLRGYGVIFYFLFLLATPPLSRWTLQPISKFYP